MNFSKCDRCKKIINEEEEEDILCHITSRGYHLKGGKILNDSVTGPSYENGGPYENGFDIDIYFTDINDSRGRTKLDFCAKCMWLILRKWYKDIEKDEEINYYFKEQKCELATNL